MKLLLVFLASLSFAQDQDADLKRALEATQVPATQGQQAPDCAAGMVGIESFCIDEYEAPNQKGAVPFSFKVAAEGEAWCRDRGKRLCTDAEWGRACRGPSNWDFPYGPSYKRGVCNDDKAWREVHWDKLAKYPKDEALKHAADLNQAEPSGARDTCVTPEGVHDLTGNVAEWVSRAGWVDGKDRESDKHYKHVMKGCFWAGCWHGVPSCGFANTHHPGAFRSYETGFRCCADRKR